jgi:hypothetical protein
MTGNLRTTEMGSPESAGQARRPQLGRRKLLTLALSRLRASQLLLDASGA